MVMNEKEVYVNLKNFDFDVMNYPLGSVEAEVIKRALRKCIEENGEQAQTDKEI